MRVDLWVGVTDRGRGVIALTKAEVLKSLAPSPTVAVSRLSAWSLSAAIARGGCLPITFELHDVPALQEVR